MTVAFWAVLLAGGLPYLFTSFAKFSGGKRYDNRKPREFLETLDGEQKRSHYAQLNSFESLPSFAAAVIISYLVAGPLAIFDVLAASYLVLRVGYGAAYIKDKATLRSGLWALSMIDIVLFYVLAFSFAKA